MVFYDGACGLCHRTVTFLLKRDPEGQHFRYSPLQGETLISRVDAETRAGLPDSVVVLTAEGQLLTKDRAVMHLLKRLGGGWAALAGAMGWFPRALRAWGYDRVAQVRSRLFKKPEGACPIIPKAWRDRFLP